MVRVIDYNADNLRKKIELKDRFPSHHSKRPFLVVYPYGGNEYKQKHPRVSHASDTFDELIEHTSDLIGDNTTHVTELTFSTVTQNTFKGGKGLVVLFHNEKVGSMSFRILSKNKTFTDDFNFVTLKNPSDKFLEHIQLEKIPAIVFFRPKMDTFFNLDNSENLVSVEYGGKFFFQAIVGFLEEMRSEYVSFMRQVQPIQSNQDLKDINTFSPPKNLDQKNTTTLEFIEKQYSAFPFADKTYGPFSAFVLIDSKREKKNEEWYDKVADMMIVRKYVGYIDVGCFGEQILNTFRLDAKKDLPKLVVFRRLQNGRPGEGIFAMEEGKFSGYSGARFLHKLITKETSLGSD